MVVREFNCMLCGRKYELLAGDFMGPSIDLCDACLTAMWELDADALTSYVSSHLNEGDARGEDVVRYVRQLRQSTSLEAVLQERDRGRRAFKPR